MCKYKIKWVHPIFTLCRQGFQTWGTEAQEKSDQWSASQNHYTLFSPPDYNTKPWYNHSTFSQQILYHCCSRRFRNNEVWSLTYYKHFHYFMTFVTWLLTVFSPVGLGGRHVEIWSDCQLPLAIIFQNTQDSFVHPTLTKAEEEDPIRYSWYWRKLYHSSKFIVWNLCPWGTEILQYSIVSTNEGFPCAILTYSGDVKISQFISNMLGLNLPPMWC